MFSLFYLSDLTQMGGSYLVEGLVKRRIFSNVVKCKLICHGNVCNSVMVYYCNGAGKVLYIEGDEKKAFLDMYMQLLEDKKQFQRVILRSAILYLAVPVLLLTQLTLGINFLIKGTVFAFLVCLVASITTLRLSFVAKKV